MQNQKGVQVFPLGIVGVKGMKTTGFLHIEKMLWAVWLGLEKSDQESALQEVRPFSMNLFCLMFS